MNEVIAGSAYSEYQIKLSDAPHRPTADRLLMAEQYNVDAPSHVIAGFADSFWTKQADALRKRARALREDCQPHGGAQLAIELQLFEARRLHLFAHGANEALRAHLKVLLSLYSAHSLPLIEVAVSGSAASDGVTAASKRKFVHCKAIPIVGAGDDRWELPLRARVGQDERQWSEVLREFLPSATLSACPHAIVDEAAQGDLASEEQCATLRRRIPRALRETLMGYQEEGVLFALRRGGRVLLADEMGLGKSLQALAIASAYAGNRAGKESHWPLLIVCPTSMRDVWLSLVERWLPAVPPEEICVLRRSLDMVTRRLVTLVSFKMLSLLSGPLKARHLDAPFKCVIVDESHNFQLPEDRKPQRFQYFGGKAGSQPPWMRNRGGGGGGRGGGRGGAGGGGGGGGVATFTDRFTTLEALCSLGEGEQKLIFLSGTPMRKSISTFYGQLRLLRPRAFGGATGFEDFCARYCNGDRAQYANEHRMEELHTYLLALVMRRRLKTDVMTGDELPPIYRQVVPVAVCGADRRRVLHRLRLKYQAALAAPLPNPHVIKRWRYSFWQATGLAKAGVKADELARTFGVTDGERKKKPQAGAAAAAGRQAADDDGGDGEDDDEEDEDEEDAPGRVVDEEEQTTEAWLKEAIEHMALPESDAAPAGGGSRTGALTSGSALGNGKMLLFAHHRRMMNACQEMLEGVLMDLSKERVRRGHAPYGFIRVDGASTDRTHLLQKFEADDNVRVALLSLTAFSQGVTLNAANVVVFLELFGNHNELAQAEARCHRKGQQRQVSVFYLNAPGSFDEIMWPRLLKQAQSTKDVIDAKESGREAEAEATALGPQEGGASASGGGGGGGEASGEGAGEGAEGGEGAPRRRKRRRVAISSMLAPEDECDEGGGGEEGAHGDDSSAAAAAEMEAEAEDGGQAEAGAGELDDLFDVESLQAAAAAERAEKRAVERAEERVGMELAASAERARAGEVGFWPSPWSQRVYLYTLAPSAAAAAAAAGGVRPHEFLKASTPTSLLTTTGDEQRDEQCANSDTPLRKYDRQLTLFKRDWQDLSTGQRAALCEWAGRQWRPLRMPLGAELELAAAAVEHAVGYSTRRHARREDFDADAGSQDALTIEWRQHRDREPRRWVVRRHPDPQQAPPTVPHGWLCLYCSGARDQSGRLCEPGAPFCSYGCEEAYRLRVSASTELRRSCFERDKGVCRACGVDCHQLYMRLKPLPAAKRREVLDVVFRAAPGDATGEGPAGWTSRLSKVRYEGIVKRCHAGDVWQADHTKAVVAGGGEATSATMLQTLCSPCHVVKTRTDLRQAATGGVRG